LLAQRTWAGGKPPEAFFFAQRRKRDSLMTDRELRKLRREDLLQMLIEQSKEVERLRAKLSEAEKALDDRTIAINKAGSIAEAALQLSGIFDAAQSACQQYTENIIRLSKQEEALFSEAEAENQIKANNIIEEAKKQAVAIEENTKQQCEEMVKAAQERSQAYWDEISNKLERFYREHTALRELLSNLPPPIK